MNRAKPIRSREDLIAYAAQYAPSKACARAISEDRATVLGGFIVPKRFPCWIVQITSRFGRTWHIAVECDEAAYTYHVQQIDNVPWLYWQGQRRGKRILIDGDEPDRGAVYRLEARRQHGHPRTTPA